MIPQPWAHFFAVAPLIIFSIILIRQNRKLRDDNERLREAVLGDANRRRPVNVDKDF